MVKMKKIYYWLVSWWLITNFCNVSSKCNFDANKDLDFCSKGCGKIKHVACECILEDECFVPVPELLDDILTFRQHCLTAHNKIRNQIALGEDEMAGTMTGTAANMNILSYDAGLEFTAGCNVKKCKMAHDRCSVTKRFHAYVGQNLHSEGGGSVVKPIKDVISGGVQSWFNEEKNLAHRELIDKFDMSNDKKGAIGHFSEVVWATLTHVGCMVARKDKGNKVFMACNYASTYTDQHHLPNLKGRPVYVRGDPASQCMEGRKKNKEYPGLCGEQEPVPTCGAASRLRVCLLCYIIVVGLFVCMFLMDAM